jgi:hypothetical protein
MQSAGLTATIEFIMFASIEIVLAHLNLVCFPPQMKSSRF